MESKALKFHASSCYKLVTDPKTNADKAAGILAQTVKTYLKEIYLKEEHGYEEPIMTDPIMKGLLNEQDSIDLCQRVMGGKFRMKNRKHFNNEHFVGTPDVILDDCIEDVKTSWDLKTFFNCGDTESSDKEREIQKAYYYQGLVYMAMLGIKSYRLIYCLTNTPEEIVNGLISRVYWKFGSDTQNPDYIKFSEQIKRNHNFDHIPDEKRIKVFEFEFDQEKYYDLVQRAVRAREYYATLKMPSYSR
jgi:hypothetical protein